MMSSKRLINKSGRPDLNRGPSAPKTEVNNTGQHRAIANSSKYTRLIKTVLL